MWLAPIALVASALAGTASALLVATDSPCSQYCGNVLSSTTPDDMACMESGQPTSAAGTVFETCIDCELQSGYTSGNESDLAYLICENNNLRYAVSYCLFGVPDNTNIEDTPCVTSTACGSLQDAIVWNNLTTHTGAYDFCQKWIETSVPKCTDCLVAGSMYFMNNYVTILNAACLQLPDSGSTLSIQGLPFSTKPVNITTPSPTPLYTYTPVHSAISLGGKVGIAVGGVVLLLVVAGFVIVCLGRRRRRTYLKNVAARYGQNNTWPSPSTNDMFDTPMSQKPLRGWDDHSPVSAATMSERSDQIGPFSRYFSPYNSQYNSPVSALDATHGNAWHPDSMAAMAAMAAGTANAANAAGVAGVADVGVPGAPAAAAHDPGIGSSTAAPYTQEEVEHMVHEQRLAHIGVAYGGSDPSPNRKASNGSLGDANAAAPRTTGASQSQPQQTMSWSESGSSGDGSKGKQPSSEESYELREIDSNGMPIAARVNPAPLQAPVLQHPGFGRGGIKYYPPPPGGPLP